MLHPNALSLASLEGPDIFNREKFSRGSRSYLVVTVTSICYKWLQKFNMLQIASKVPIATKSQHGLEMES